MTIVQEGTLAFSGCQNKGRKNGDLEHDSTIRIKVDLGIVHRGPIN
ncbi:hypothetical protein THOG05_240027 [Vibrio rotiferianus]|nr:hypothetical protein THOG05_240027 [Vibrio rotiferianus]CAH1558538.1 hypothetical protein THOE12_190080 [Vibrio rotiferianus]CAH1574661.1 hypothetical protein THOG10_220076 [Vibrio rotiferianus]CAH1576694.1 hypothetical protein THOB06_220076 [Vibrio rotiferianus]